MNHTVNELKKEIEGKVKLTLPSELKKITSTFVVEGAQTIENEEYEETIKDVEERVTCKALINQDDTEGNMYAGVYVFKNVKQEAFKYDTMNATYENGNASMYAGGDSLDGDHVQPQRADIGAHEDHRGEPSQRIRVPLVWYH